MKKIPLSQGQYAIIDDDDFKYLSQFKWYAARHKRTWYAVTCVKNKNGEYRARAMHRILLGLSNPKVFTDHIDHNGLNNQRTNLRTCSNKQNGHNRRPHTGSRFKGVTFDQKRGDFKSQIIVSGKYIYLGYFDNEIDGAKAYNEAAIKYYGKFANINQIQ